MRADGRQKASRRRETRALCRPRTPISDQKNAVEGLLTDCRITITIGSMRNCISAQVVSPEITRRHVHTCITCGARYECRGPEETGDCAPVCQPCYWIELGAQVRIYRDVVAELEGRRLEIEQRIGTDTCRTAAARRRQHRSDSGLLVAFGNVFDTSRILGIEEDANRIEAVPRGESYGR
jgi:hypothetical protein